MDALVHVQPATMAGSFLICGFIGLCVGVLLFFRAPDNSTVRAVLLRAIFYSVPIGLGLNIGMESFMGESRALEYVLFALFGALGTTLFAILSLTAGLPVLRYWIGISKADCTINAMGQMRLKM